jgi:hypothetical protein
LTVVTEHPYPLVATPDAGMQNTYGRSGSEGRKANSGRGSAAAESKIPDGAVKAAAFAAAHNRLLEKRRIGMNGTQI